MSTPMFVKVTPSQYDTLARCALAFEMGLKGPHGWRPEDVYDQLEKWAMCRDGFYDKVRHMNGEPVRIEVVRLIDRLVWDEVS